jgi:hypothetical protein
VPPPPPDLYPLLARGPTISAIHVRNGAASARTNASCASGSGQHVQSFREASSNGNSAAGADVVSPRTDVCDIEGDAGCTQNDESSIDEYEYDTDVEVSAQCRDPFDKSYKNKLLSDLVTPSPRDKLYSFLLSRKVGEHLKGMNGPLKKHSIPQGSSKQTLVASLLHVVAKTVLHSEGSTGYDDGVVFGPGDVSKWFEDDCRPAYSVFEAPGDDVLDEFAPAASRSGKRKAGGGGHGAYLTVNEFARLVAILITDDNVRRDLVRSGKSLTRGELDRRMGRDDFWVKVVEPKFNYPSTCALLRDVELPPCLIAVDPSAQPTTHRSSDALKRKFYDSRSSFTAWYSNWSVSGQNDPNNFPEYVAQPPNGSEVYPNQSLCAMLLFYAMGCGAESDSGNHELLSWIAKVGQGENAWDDEYSDAVVQKKVRADSAATEMTTALLPVMKRVSESMEAMVSGGVEARSSRDVSAAEAEVFRAESMSRLLAQARKLSSDIRVAGLDSEDTEARCRLHVRSTVLPIYAHHHGTFSLH